MMKTINQMKKIIQGHDIEVCNYNYIRFKFDPDEINEYSNVGVDLMGIFLESIESAKQSIKENYSINISVQVTGINNNVILVGGAGQLHDALPNDFMNLIDLPNQIKESIKKEKEREINPPVVRSAIDILREIDEPAPVQSSGSSNEDAIARPETTSITSPVARKPIKKVKTVKKTRTSKNDDSGSYLKAIIDRDEYAEVSSLVKSLMNDLKMKKDDASDAVSKFIESNKDVSEDEGMVFKI